MQALANILSRVTRRRLIVGWFVLVAACAAAGWFALRPPEAVIPGPVAPGDAINPPAPSTVLVFVSGAVVQPGLYELSPDARVADAIAAAGGMTSSADRGHLPNLAARVHDGRQVNVPFVKSGSAAAARLDINSATEDELSSVPGMPAGLPAAIVQFRDEWGGFTTLSELRTDLGVDSATVSGLGHYLRVVPPGA